MVGWWPWDGTGTDIQGNNPATLSGGPDFVSGEVDQALAFDGANDYARVTGAPSLNVGVGSGMTIDAWIKPGDVASQRPLIEFSGGTTGVHMWTSVTFGGAVGPANLYVNLGDTSGASHIISSAPGIMTANSWQHVALTYDRTTGVAMLYRNGAVVAQQNLGIFPPLTSTDLYIGRRPGTGFFYLGQIDELDLFNRVLSAAEIQAIVDAGSAGKCKPDAAGAFEVERARGWWRGWSGGAW